MPRPQKHKASDCSNTKSQSPFKSGFCFDSYLSLDNKKQVLVEEIVSIPEEVPEESHAGDCFLAEFLVHKPVYYREATEIDCPDEQLSEDEEGSLESQVEQHMMNVHSNILISKWNLYL